MKRAFVTVVSSAAQWTVIFAIIFMLFDGFIPASEWLLMFVVFFTPILVLFACIQHFGDMTVTSPLNLLRERRTRERRKLRNIKEIDDRAERFLAKLQRTVETGTVVSSETVPITSVFGSFQGGGGNIYEGLGGITGNIREVFGGITSRTDLLSRFFVDVGGAEYVFTLGGNDFAVRTGSELRITWLENPRENSYVICKIENIQTRRCFLFEDSVTKIIAPILAAQRKSDPDFEGIPDIPFHRSIAKILSNEQQ